jgi:hypothetical protein
VAIDITWKFEADANTKTFRHALVEDVGRLSHTQIVV